MSETPVSEGGLNMEGLTHDEEDAMDRGLGGDEMSELESLVEGVYDGPHDDCDMEGEHSHQINKPQMFVAGTERPVWFIAVYSVRLAYGGPEEGGWWYDTGELVRVEVATNEDSARQRANQLRTEGAYKYTGKRSSMGRDREDYDTLVLDSVPEPYYPRERPHYE